MSADMKSVAATNWEVLLIGEETFKSELNQWKSHFKSAKCLFVETSTAKMQIEAIKDMAVRAAKTNQNVLLVLTGEFHGELFYGISMCNVVDMLESNGVKRTIIVTDRSCTSTSKVTKRPKSQKIEWIILRADSHVRAKQQSSGFLRELLTAFSKEKTFDAAVQDAARKSIIAGTASISIYKSFADTTSFDTIVTAFGGKPFDTIESLQTELANAQKENERLKLLLKDKDAKDANDPAK